MLPTQGRRPPEVWSTAAIATAISSWSAATWAVVDEAFGDGCCREHHRRIASYELGDRPLQIGSIRRSFMVAF